MRRIFWLTLVVLVSFLIAGGLVYFTNPFSARTWMLEKALRSPVSSVRAAAERKLAAGDPEEAADAFVDAHRDASGELLDGSARRFRLLPPETAGKLAEMLEDPDAARATAAADGLAALAEHYKDHDFSAVLPALLRAMERKNTTLGWSAAWVAHRIAPRNHETAEAIVCAARNGNPQILGFLETTSLSATDVSQLLECLVSEDFELRATVAYLLGSLKFHEERVVPSLVALLEDRNALLVTNALYSLERLEHRDSATVGKAIDLLRREDVLPVAVGFVLRSTAFPEALAAIKADLRESSRARAVLEVLRYESRETLSPELIPDLMDLCRGADRALRLAAVHVLAQMGGKATSAMPAIKELLAKKEDPEFEQAARFALEDINDPEPAPSGD